MLIDDARINALAGRADLVREFPALRTTTEAPRGCRGCGGGGGRVLHYNAVMASLAGMPDDRKELFKRLLGVPAYRVIYEAGGRVVDQVC